MYRFVIFLSLFNFGLCQTKVSSCKKHAPPIQVIFNDCIQPPCDLIRGTNGTTKITFKANSDSTTFKAKVRGTWFGIGVDHDLGEQGANGCGFLKSGSCPLVSGKEYGFEIVEKVKPNEIKVNGVSLTYKILDENSNIITCFGLTANVVDRKGEADEDYDDDDEDE